MVGEHPNAPDRERVDERFLMLACASVRE